MKKSLLLFLILSGSSLFLSCQREEDTGSTLVAVPVTVSLEKFRSSVKVTAPRNIKESGKIYAWKNYIFINDKNEGVHIIDNTDRFNPKKISFLKIPRNMDIAIKDDMLYADNGMDLVVFDLSDMANIHEINRIEDVFPNYFNVAPAGAEYVDFQNFDPQNEVIVGYVYEKKKIEYAPDIWMTVDEAAAYYSNGNTGQGGSMARFSIKDDYLYVAEETKLSVFDISMPEDTDLIHEEYAGWQIETIFNADDYLYLGSATGMYIYSIEDPASPRQVSFLQHVMGCDPVVVKDNYAYVTIRNGNSCGQAENLLDIVDISDKSEPFIANRYEMENPHGMGTKDNWLFVCDGSAGLKVYDIENTPDLRLIDQFSNINTYDVIPMEDKLLMVGDNILYQYSYKGNEVSLLSSFALN
ncbi:hypothetical protein C7S20_04030 [Christiangramia fulva]|uniref:LVIVD repeat-containing protein n=1 Tax=Christiangramia fulva TaxID=2126553 RepID=A0A2R3Z2L8_9FLAO|nr:hypothetical protein [Christiangramia fulva]AVR44497.1 hypothetical protein C7S20_04030 [Christiangramia fulva]